ncbi:MAG: mercuric transporter MerT family protein [Gemmatimonadales bacterium]
MILGKTIATAVGGVATATASALCCAGPVLAVTAGVSSAGLSATFEPLRPYMLVATVGLLGAGFYQLHREETKACDPDAPCASSRVRRLMKVSLWTATGLAVALATFPTWSEFIF